MTTAPCPQQAHDPDYETWFAGCFDRPAGDDPFDDWYWTALDDPFALSPSIAARHVLRLLEDPGRQLETHHPNQIASGLKYIFDPGCGGDARLIGAPEVAQADRLAFAARIDRLYGELFGPLCPPVLGHLSEEGGRLAGLAYMFWDVVCFDMPPREQDAQAFREALLEAMGRTLALPHAGAQEGALHGLGHWGSANPRLAERIIDRWLDEGRPARPELITYARGARCGCVL
ncbi:MAG TPA: hypothetical protein VMM55_02295 [Thermohalobaculum sp.]|nr:hypothetical protein [Thermohalobaculum sp.]